MRKLFFLLSSVFLFAENNQTKSIEAAKKIALVASTEYLKVLKNAMKSHLMEKGPKGAIDYCNKNAYPLTMKTSVKLSRKLHVRLKLKRISFKNRNVADYPNATDVPILKELSKTDPKHPKMYVKEYPTRIDVYQPIYVQKICLRCHGKHLNKDVVKELDKYYENDKARGYKVGDFRGAVVVTIDKKSLEKYLHNQ
ncbi:Tll0287-like domain-containing protein [Caminibacter pacificus]|uniref:DUF3365 domain-containing protein n=1 Tax=Caminibacter pacificus TaxID=1424653 RepID=A0AAJ4UX47_9BACT|nr:DUF3365 domain-containing protein [Caminibacter pacificus]QCI27463.1 DUF3365 domain-containing protein [Caminibacter pacificus]ROR38900.1 uncharacterized protein DUF3365 [Caminibacter pacificus]